MTETENAFLIVLKDALHPGDENELTNLDWTSVLDTAKKQNLFPFVYDALSTYSAFQSFADSHSDFFVAATVSMSAQMQKTDEFLSLYKAFLAVGLSPITMKGIICRDLYGERADFRPSGDEDILIEKKDYRKAVEILESCGYLKEDEPDRNMAVIQEVTFYSEGLTVEVHLNPFGTDTITREKMNNWFSDVFRREETINIKGVPVRTMTPTDHFLFLVFHAFKHFTGGGFGVRMMLDILLFAEKYEDGIDWKYVGEGLADVGATGFLADLLEIGNQYLGFEFSQQMNHVCPDELLDDMFSMGAFGNTTRADHVAAQFISDAMQRGVMSNRKISKVRSMLQRLFPSWRSWTTWHPYLKDKPWMLPGEWVKRLVRYLRGNADMGAMKEISKSYKIAERRLELLKKYDAV